MTQFLPPNLLALFAAREPIPYLPPAAKLPHEKKQKGYDGVGAFLNVFEVSLLALFIDILVFFLHSISTTYLRWINGSSWKSFQFEVLKPDVGCSRVHWSFDWCDLSVPAHTTKTCLLLRYNIKSVSAHYSR